MGKAYVYYSYEQFGRGYIGARCRSPVDDDYFGTYSERTFKPTEKIVLAEFETIEEAFEAEVLLHDFFEVAANPHFANKAKQTSSGFSTAGVTLSEEERKKKGKPGVAKTKEHVDAVVLGKRRSMWKKEWWDYIKTNCDFTKYHNGVAAYGNKIGHWRIVSEMAELIKEGVSWEEAMGARVKSL